MRKNLLYASLLLALLLAVLHMVALAFYFYWSLGWYDYMTHFLGGLVLGAFILSFGRLSGWQAFLLVMALGGAWEAFEYVNDLTAATEGYALDTIHDLLMDALGGWAAISLSRRLP